MKSDMVSNTKPRHSERSEESISPNSTNKKGVLIFIYTPYIYTEDTPYYFIVLYFFKSALNSFEATSIPCFTPL